MIYTTNLKEWLIPEKNNEICKKNMLKLTE